MFLASFSFVAQPLFDAQSLLLNNEISDDDFIHNENSFIIEDENGDLKLYMGDKFIDIIPDNVKDELLENADIRYYTENKEDKIK